jgi:hypothetical protein
MTHLKQQAPFTWLEPRVREGMTIYEHNPPCGELALVEEELTKEST